MQLYFPKLLFLKRMLVKLKASSESTELILGMLMKFEYQQIRKQRYKYGIKLPEIQDISLPRYSWSVESSNINTDALRSDLIRLRAVSFFS